MRADTAGGTAPPRISHIGLVARSPEGHAARTMQIKGHEDQWVDIQAHTFRNWVNEHVSPSNRVRDLAEDLKDGRVLCELVESLQNKKVPGWRTHSPGNRHQMLENVSKALTAVADDGVKLVNIGECDNPLPHPYGPRRVDSPETGRRGIRTFYRSGVSTGLLRDVLLRRVHDAPFVGNQPLFFPDRTSRHFSSTFPVCPCAVIVPYG